MTDVEKNLPSTESGGAETEVARLSAQDESGAPPSYDSVFKRLQSVKDESNGPKDCISKFLVILCGSITGTILIGIVLAIPITMIVIGSLYLHDCPAERYIPIYLIVGGVFGAIQSLLTTSLRIRNQVKKNEEENARPSPGSGILSCFLLAWFIAGSVWVYRIYGTVTTTNQGSDLYCHPTVYWFTFVTITVGYAMLLLACCCSAIVGLLACCLTNSD